MALEPVIPCIKHIYTVSFTCQAMGWCVLALTLLYVLTDVFGLRFGWWFVTLYGQCALTAYMATHFFRPSLEACTKSITKGFPRFIDKAYMPLAEALVTVIVLTIVLVIRRRLRGAKKPDADDTDETSDGQDDAQGAAPEFKSKLMAGAIATRFQIPGMESQSPEAKGPEEATSQAAHVKTKLKLH